MTQHYEGDFDESLVSGYLDGELTQADEQRVRLHLEENPDAREMMQEMQRIRHAARSTTLPAPTDEEWNEAPRSGGSRWTRRIGWVLTGAVFVTLAGMGIWGLAVGSEAWWEKLLMVAIVGGPLLLLVSVLMDRLKVLRHDRYRGVEK